MVKIDHFLEVLSNWYIRRNKDRFWSSVEGDDVWSAMALEKTGISNFIHLPYAFMQLFCFAFALYNRKDLFGA